LFFVLFFFLFLFFVFCFPIAEYHFSAISANLLFFLFFLFLQ